MLNKSSKLISVLLVLSISFLCFTASAFATAGGEALSYKISEDGFAMVYECDKTATGSVTVPSNVTIDGKSYKVKYIGARAFDGCDYITDITISEGVTSVGNHAFRDCMSLRDLYVPESLIVCQYDAFDGCEDVTVHCYISNYQFFSIFGISAISKIDVLDAESEEDIPEDSATTSDNFILNFIEALKKMINSLMEYFNADDDDDFEIDLPFELPFEISA